MIVCGISVMSCTQNEKIQIALLDVRNTRYVCQVITPSSAHHESILQAAAFTMASIHVVIHRYKVGSSITIMVIHKGVQRSILAFAELT